MTGITVGPEDAYHFARGEEVVSSTGQPVRLSRPLDFLVVADHSDDMGMAPDFFAGKPEILADRRELWKWMANYDKETGGDILAIAHNGNVSNGVMFPIIEPTAGTEINRE